MEKGLPDSHTRRAAIDELGLVATRHHGAGRKADPGDETRRHTQARHRQQPRAGAGEPFEHSAPYSGSTRPAFAVRRSFKTYHFMRGASDQARGRVARHAPEEVWRARDYAELHEGLNRRDYREGLRCSGVRAGSVVLDLGCGPGGFCRLAADAGALVTGLDASPAMIEIARERVPEARFDVGDMQRLPYARDAFDVVTAFSSLQFTADPLAVLADVRRVARPGASVFIVVFGREERVEFAAAWRALAPLLPRTAAGFPGPLAPLSTRRAQGSGALQRPHG